MIRPPSFVFNPNLPLLPQPPLQTWEGNLPDPTDTLGFYWETRAYMSKQDLIQATQASTGFMERFSQRSFAEAIQYIAHLKNILTWIQRQHHLEVQQFHNDRRCDRRHMINSVVESLNAAYAPRPPQQGDSPAERHRYTLEEIWELSARSAAYFNRYCWARSHYGRHAAALTFRWHRVRQQHRILPPPPMEVLMERSVPQWRHLNVSLRGMVSPRQESPESSYHTPRSPTPEEAPEDRYMDMSPPNSDSTSTPTSDIMVM